MLSFKRYLVLCEARAKDVLAKYPHLSGLPTNHLNKYGMALGKMEDLPKNSEKISQTLDAYNKHRSKIGDFGQHKSFEAVQTALKPHIEKAEKTATEKAEGSKGETVLHDDGKGTSVKEIHTAAAAQQSKYCDKTGWCVSRKGESGEHHFETYEMLGGSGEKGKGRMFVLHTPDKELYAHHEGEGSVIRDADNNGIPIHRFVEKYPQFSNVKALHGTRYGLHFNVNASSEELSNAFKNARDHADKLDVLNHRNADVEHINMAIKDEKPGIRAAAARHPKATAEHIEAGLKDISPDVQREAIRNPNATSAHIDMALGSRHKEVRKSAILHSSATPAHIDKALQDQDFSVRAAAVSRPDVTPEHLNKGLTDEHPVVRGEVAKRPEYAGHLANDPSWNVRYQVAFHPQHAGGLLNDPDPGVRKKAETTISLHGKS